MGSKDIPELTDVSNQGYRTGVIDVSWDIVFYLMHFVFSKLLRVHTFLSFP